MNTSTLETERLILRKFTENDFASLFKIYSFAMVSVRVNGGNKNIFEEKYAKAYELPCGYKYAIC